MKNKSGKKYVDVKWARNWGLIPALLIALSNFVASAGSEPVGRIFQAFGAFFGGWLLGFILLIVVSFVYLMVKNTLFGGGRE